MIQANDRTQAVENKILHPTEREKQMIRSINLILIAVAMLTAEFNHNAEPHTHEERVEEQARATSRRSRD